MQLRQFVRSLVILTVLLSLTTTALAQGGVPPRPDRPMPERLADLKLAEPAIAESYSPLNKLNPALVGAQGRRQVVVQLTAAPVAALAAADQGAAAQQAQAESIQSQQAAVVENALSLDTSAQVLGQVTKALNAVILEVDAASLTALAANPAVRRISPLVDYELDLSETVPYIGARPEVQALAANGEGIEVAVIDSGVDFTHAKLGGVGTFEAFAAAYCGSPTAVPSPFNPACTAHTLAPTFNDKVIGGYDFVGERWSGGAGSPPLAPDPNPIDFEGHGTHVADIIGGLPFPDPARARVRAAHLSPDAPNVDILVNDGIAFADVPFKAVSGYATLPPGTYNIKVVPTGASAPVVIDADVTVEAGKDYTVAATNVLASITPLVLVDDNSAPAAGNAHVRFVHASPNAPAVDIAVAGGGPVVIANTAFGNASAYTPVPAGTYPLEVRLAGTSTVVLSLGNVNLEDGKVYTAFAVGLVGGAGAQALGAVLTEDNATAGGGVAPGVSIYAIKACSAVSSSCSGLALLNAMDFAVDPNNDGDLSDHVDIINMSLGSSYGIAYDDSLSAAVNYATDVGALTVASAGNSADKPYVAGTPSAAISALSVAQTQVPSATRYQLRINSPAAIAGLYSNTETVSWAPITTGFTGDVVFVGRGCRDDETTAAVEPTDPYLANPAGKVALIDRGACAISVKVDRAAKAGATAVLIGLVAPGDAVTFSQGGGDTFVQTMIIIQSTSNAIKAQLNAGNTVNVSVNQADALPLVGSVVGSSSRGPNSGNMFADNRVMYGQLIKPEIGAPGASLSAEVGTGTGITAFGGTSGAAPMVSGAAALLLNSKRLQGELTIGPREIKSMLMNTAETEIYNTPAALGGGLAPITRIGGGEVRVDRAINSEAAAYEFNNRTGALSFGFLDITRATRRVSRTVVVENYSDSAIRYTITPTFRFANDESNGAISVSAPASIRVPANSSRSFRVTLTIDGAKLRTWALNSGSQGASGSGLTTFEYDGYLLLDDSNPATDDDLHLAWQVLPRQSGDVRPNRSNVRLTGTTDLGGGLVLPSGEIDLRNRGIGTATVDAYSLVGTSFVQDGSPYGQDLSITDLKAVGVATFPVGAGFCSANPSFLMSFAVSTWQRQSHANFPASFEIYLDTNRDGTDDYVVLNWDLGYPGLGDGRNATWVFNLTTGSGNAFFPTDHALVSGNTVLTLCAEQIGMTQANFFQVMNVDVLAWDLNSGLYTDAIENLQLAPLGERYLALGNDVAPGATETWTVVDFGAAGTNPSETGVLFLLDAVRASNLRGGAPEGNENLLIPVLP